MILHFHSLRPGVLLRNFKFESPHFVVERHACATPLRGAGKIFRLFFQNDKNNALSNKWCVSHFFPRLSFFHEILKKQQKIQQFLTKILRLEIGAKECIV